MKKVEFKNLRNKDCFFIPDLEKLVYISRIDSRSLNYLVVEFGSKEIEVEFYNQIYESAWDISWLAAALAEDDVIRGKNVAHKRKALSRIFSNDYKVRTTVLTKTRFL